MMNVSQSARYGGLGRAALTSGLTVLMLVGCAGGSGVKVPVDERVIAPAGPNEPQRAFSASLWERKDVPRADGRSGDQVRQASPALTRSEVAAAAGDGYSNHNAPESGDVVVRGVGTSGAPAEQRLTPLGAGNADGTQPGDSGSEPLNLTGPAGVSQPVQRNAPPGPQLEHDHPAVRALVAQAEQDHQAGQLPKAAASIERALRIQPGDPGLWYRLAAVRRDQGLVQQAANFARKSNTLVPEGDPLRAYNQSIIDAAGSG